MDIWVWNMLQNRRFSVTGILVLLGLFPNPLSV